MRYTRLPQRGLLSLSGEDAVGFLQGLITQDALKLQKGEPLYAALLSPQGKFLHDFFLIQTGNAIWLDGEKERLDDLRKRLSLYKLRSKVTIEALPESMGVVAAWGEDAAFAQEGIAAIADSRLQAMGLRILGNIEKIESGCAAKGWRQATPEDYERLRIAHAIPDGSRDLIADKSLLLEWGFEDLHGVDFKKGCYVGQEVTARSKYRGQVRKCVYKIRVVAGQLPETGTKIEAGAAEVGQLRSHAGGEGLALLRSEEVRKAARDGVALRAGNAIVEASVPEWIRENAQAYVAE